jgi:F-type H+-transporting ATPase subunit delta
MAKSKRAKKIARQLFQLCRENGSLDADRVRLVARRLGEGRERGSLAVLAELNRRVRLDRARHTALVESAVPLTEERRRDVEASLARLHGPGLAMSYVLNPGLIGGLRVTVGSDVYDGSVRRRLAAIEERL